MTNERFLPWLEVWNLIPEGASFTTKCGSHLLPVIKDGRTAMLKIPGGEEERRGAALMSWYAGVGAAEVLGDDGKALLLERLPCQRSLAEMARSGEDDAATHILCRVAAELHAPRERAPPASLVPLDLWFTRIESAGVAFGGTFAKSAEAARLLLGAPRDVVVLHGDYHHDNVLDGGERGWLAIDPKGLIGERGFEYANLFRNPDATVALAPGRMRRQANIVAAQAGLELGRLFQWILAYAGLGAAWSHDSGHSEDAAIGIAIAEAAASELRHL